MHVTPKLQCDRSPAARRLRIVYGSDQDASGRLRRAAEYAVAIAAALAASYLIVGGHW